MDFEIVKRQIIFSYLEVYGEERKDGDWSIKDCLDVFAYFYREYWQIMGRDHPRLTKRTVQDIVSRLPYTVESYCYGQEYDLSPSDYPPMIDAYFAQEFKNCNYSIAHFMSGNIRTLRYYETLY